MQFPKENPKIVSEKSLKKLNFSFEVFLIFKISKLKMSSFSCIICFCLKFRYTCINLNYFFSGIDIPAFLESVGATQKIIDMMRNSQTGYVAVAYTMYKIATPVRYSVTLGKLSNLKLFSKFQFFTSFFLNLYSFIVAGEYISLSSRHQYTLMNVKLRVASSFINVC